MCKVKNTISDDASELSFLRFRGKESKKISDSFVKNILDRGN